jgi:phenylacetate-coenzyme A ligase PaaK-like adenylate-forming protein
MLHRTLFNGVRGFVAAYAAYPLAEWMESRDVRSKARALEREMALPFTRRRSRSYAEVVEIVRHASVNVPYYRDLFSRIGFEPEKLKSDARYLQDIPYLTKDIIRAERDRLLRHDHANVRKHISKTGGSTGPSTLIVYDQEAADWSSATTRVMRASIGKRHFHSELHFASRFPEKFPLRDRLRERAKCLAMNRHNLFFANFEPDSLDAIWHRLGLIRPHLVHGHPSTMYQLALHVRARRIDGAAAFRVFESSGESLEDYQRDTIASVFQCDIVDRYGLAEVGIAAYQAARDDRTMLVIDPLVWPEIAGVDSSEGLSANGKGEAGELVVTATRNRMMPLIRYRTGDLAVLSETDGGFILDKLVGRVHDVINIGGRKVPTHYIQDVVDRIGGTKEFQIELRNPGPVLRLVPEEDANLDDIRARIGRFWNEELKVEFISASELQLSGWRHKFHHVVRAPSNAGLTAADPVPIQ